MLTKKQLYYLHTVFCNIDTPEADEALDAFRAFESGEKDPWAKADPNDFPEFEYFPERSDYAVAYIDTMSAFKKLPWAWYKKLFRNRSYLPLFLRRCDECKKRVGFRSFQTNYGLFCSHECCSNWIPF